MVRTTEGGSYEYEELRAPPPVPVATAVAAALPVAVAAALPVAVPAPVPYATLPDTHSAKRQKKAVIVDVNGSGLPSVDVNGKACPKCKGARGYCWAPGTVGHLVKCTSRPPKRIRNRSRKQPDGTTAPKRVKRAKPIAAATAAAVEVMAEPSAADIAAMLAVSEQLDPSNQLTI